MELYYTPAPQGKTPAERKRVALHNGLSLAYLPEGKKLRITIPGGDAAKFDLELDYAELADILAFYAKGVLKGQ